MVLRYVLASILLISLSFSTRSQISANFQLGSIADSLACIGQPIIFQDLSNGNPSNWYWEFGDGNTSTSQNPSHVYMTSGAYSVKLIVSNGVVIDSLEVTNILNILKNPMASYSAISFIQQSFVPIQFTNLSQDAVYYTWDFGDATISHNENPIHSYSGPGIYSVTLSAYADSTVNICADTLVYQMLIEPTNSVTPSQVFSKVHSYPNPSYENFNIDLGKIVKGGTYTITDAIGRIIRTNIIDNLQYLNIDIEKSPGLYLLIIQFDNNVETIQLIKK